MDLSPCEEFLLEDLSSSDDSDIETLLENNRQQMVEVVLAVKELEDADARLLRGESYVSVAPLPEKCSFDSEDAEGDRPQISESSAKGKKTKKQKGATSVVSQQGKQPSITECLEVLNDMDDVPDVVKIFASDVFKDAANREIFLGYNSRLRGMWLKKEVNKISPQPPPSRFSSGGIP